MWPAIIGLLILSLIVFFFGMVSARARSSEAMKSVAFQSPTNMTDRAPQDHNQERPAAMAMSGSTSTNSSKGAGR
jgi:hypothetical protein